jgi:c-di-GMP-binding flagellar brake protein YcgR
MINVDDKRDYYRMMLNSDVCVTIIDSEANRQVNATCRDLSATGIAIEMDHPIELSTYVRIKVNSPSDQVQPLNIQGRVVRVDEEESNCYLIGISIEELA